MKIQCNVCQTAAAMVFCCADEAALCRTCDEQVHAANKLASKHQRLLLSNSNSKMPNCDICQESAGFFFCMEDRALLCRKCDVSMHTVNTCVSSHQRFLLTGVKVGCEASGLGAPSSPGKLHSTKNSVPSISTDQHIKPVPVQAADSVPSPSFARGSSANDFQQWQFDKFLGFTDVNQNCNFINNVSSKADTGKLGDSDYSSILRAMEAELDELLGQVPVASSAVPQISSPPTITEVNWPKSNDHQQLDSAAFVPDIRVEDLYCSLQSTSSVKRRRHF